MAKPGEMIFSSWPVWIQTGLILIALAFLLGLCVLAIIEIIKSIRDAFDSRYGRSNRDIDLIEKILSLSSLDSETKLQRINFVVQSNVLHRLQFIFPICEEEEELAWEEEENPDA